MDWEAHRRRIVDHLISTRILSDRAWAEAATARYARLPHLQGLEEEVEAEWARRFVGPLQPHRRPPSP